MKAKIRRMYCRFLALTGVLLGFSSMVIAQYGAPPTHFRLNGTIRSSPCETPLAGIKLTLTKEPGTQNLPQTIVTDQFGNFSLVLSDEDFYNRMDLSAEDMDGPENGGLFIKTTSPLVIDKLKFNELVTTRFYEDPDPYVIKMKYKDKPPCDSVLVKDFKDSIPENKPDTSSATENTARDLKGFKIGPGLSSGKFKIEFSSEFPSDAIVKIYSISLDCVQEESLGKCTGAVSREITLKFAAPAGFYVQLCIGKKVYQKQFIKL
jgi:putative lipoprotein (rSAM/lipoprotein system)